MLFPKSITVFILTLIALDMCSQEKVVDYQLPPALRKEVNASMFYSNGNDVLADVQKNEAGIRLLIKEGAVPEIVYQYGSDTESSAAGYIHSSNEVTEIRSLQWLGGIAQGAVLDDCYFSAGTRSIYIVETDTSKGTNKVTDTLQFTHNEHLITVVEEGGKLFVVSYLDKSDIIYIRVKQPTQKLVGFEKVMAVAAGREYRRKDPHFSDFFKDKNEAGFFIYDLSHPYPSNMPASAEKIYHFPGKLIFSLENPNQQTNIVSLSLVDFSHLFYSVPPPFKPVEFVDLAEDATSSFLWNDILFKTGNYGGYLYITATNINSAVVLCNYITKLSKSVEVATTTFFKTGHYNELAKEKKEKLHKYLEQPSIGIHHAGGSVFEIEISCMYKRSSWATILLSAATSFAGTYAINSIPRVRGLSLFFLYHQQAISVKNSLDISTGNFSNSLDSSFTSDSWEDKVSRANSFAGKNKRYHPANLMKGDVIYVYFVNEDEGRFYVYKF